MTPAIRNRELNLITWKLNTGSVIIWISIDAAYPIRCLVPRQKHSPPLWVFLVVGRHKWTRLTFHLQYQSRSGQGKAFCAIDCFLAQMPGSNTWDLLVSWAEYQNNNTTVCSHIQNQGARILCSLKNSKVENFCRFCRSENGHEKFLPWNFKFITDARCGWKTEHEKLSIKLIFEQNLAKPQNI